MLDDYGASLAEFSSTPILPATAVAHFIAGMESNIEVEGMETNLSILLVGPSSVSHKSTLVDKALSSAKTTKASPGTSTGMMDLLKASNKVIFHDDEFGRFLKQSRIGSAGRRDILDLLNTLMAGGSYTTPCTARQKSVTVPKKKIGFIACTTPEAFHENASMELMEGGFLKRFLVFLLGNQGYVSRRNKNNLAPTLPVTVISRITCFLSDATWKIHDEFMTRALDAEDSLAGEWQRGEESIFKIAAIRCAYRIGNKPVINVYDWKFARDIVALSIVNKIQLVK